MPSAHFTGGYQMLAYLDPSEPKHANLEKLIFFLLKSSRDKVFSQFESCYTELFETVEKELAEKGKSSFDPPNKQAAFNFLNLAFFGSNPTDTKLGVDDEAEKMGISREEACHNLLFTTCFNAFDGMKLFFSVLVKWIGRGGGKLHTELAHDIRSVIKPNDGKLSISMATMEQMPLMKSGVYEALRIEPPVPYQYGKAKKDLLIESHDAVYEIQGRGRRETVKVPALVERTRDGAYNDGDKQCASKDFVVLVSRLLVVELFTRYDTFEIELGQAPWGFTVTITSLKRESFQTE
ncbi:mediator of RNA polymerase II transcription subunit 18-like [Hibiscus syriacus]|uniref:Mediator of RNA polymerase II transcription subunit 18-like n=1 Tax=Hibiscus syriacus TaxID=106335 RepID=A0A6A3D0A9_HIBSY|nr:mediator of RNA polymerase II transcription subunit 18-like [Hibiscus syriacus]